MLIGALDTTAAKDSEMVLSPEQVAAALEKMKQATLDELSAAEQANRQVVTAAVRDYGTDLQYASEAFRDEPGVVLAAVETEGFGVALHWASERLRADREVVLAAVQCVGCALKFASEELRADRDVVLAAAKKGSDDLCDGGLDHDLFEYSDADDMYHLEVLQYASEAIRSDKQVVIAAVTTEAGNFRHASPELRRDPDVINAAWEKEPAILSTLDPDVAASVIDRTFALAAVERAPRTLEHLNNILKADRQIVRTAVKHEGACIQFASDDLRADRELAEIAIGNEGVAVQYLAPVLRCDREILLKALEQGFSCVTAATPKEFYQRFAKLVSLVGFIAENLTSLGELCNDRTFILAIMHILQDSRFRLDWPARVPLTILRNAGSALRGDKEIVAAVVASTASAFEIASQELKSDRAFVLQLVLINGAVLRHSSSRLRADKEVVMAAVRQCGISLQWADAGLKADRDIVLVAMSQNLESIEHASDDLKADKTFLLKAFKQAAGSAIGSFTDQYSNIEAFIPTVFKQDSEVVLAAILASGNSTKRGWWSTPLRTVPDSLKRNVTFLQELVEGFSEQLCTANKKLAEMSKTAKTNEAVLERHATNTLPQQLWAGREEGTLVSVDLVGSDGDRVAAHCEVLSLRSPVFSSMFASNFTEGKGEGRKEVLIADVDSQTLLEMVRWVYTGAVAEGVMERLACSLFQVANKYNIAGLQSAAQKAIVNALKPRDAVSMLQLADRHSVEDFKRSVSDFICDHWEEVMQTEVIILAAKQAYCSSQCVVVLAGSTQFEGTSEPINMGTLRERAGRSAFEKTTS